MNRVIDRVQRQLNHKPQLQREFEAQMSSVAPEFFIPGVSGRVKRAAMNRVLGVPSSVLSTPQDRLLTSLSYSSGVTARKYSPDIPRSLYPYWILRLQGNLSKTEACAGTLVSEGPLPLISGMRVFADGELLQDIDPMHLRVLDHHIGRGVDTSLTNITLGTDVSEAFSARLVLDWRTLRSEKPDATYFPGDRYGQLSMEVDWAATSATSIAPLVSGGSYTGVSFTTNPTLEIWGKEILDPAKRAANYWIQKRTQKIFSVSSTAQTQGQFLLPYGEVIRGILISQYTNSPRVPLSTLVTATGNIKIRANGSFFKYETSWQELQQKNLADYGVAMPTGYAFIDFMDPDNGGLYETAFNTGNGISQLEALVDTASVANAFLQFTLVTFKPARNFA